MLFHLFCNVLMLSSIRTGCILLPLKTFCCPPSLHSSLAKNRAPPGSGADLLSVCLAHEESRDLYRDLWGPWGYLKALVVSRQAALLCVPKEFSFWRKHQELYKVVSVGNHLDYRQAYARNQSNCVKTEFSGNLLAQCLPISHGAFLRNISGSYMYNHVHTNVTVSSHLLFWSDTDGNIHRLLNTFVLQVPCFLSCVTVHCES